MYGLQAKSDNDILILDGEYYNYTLKGGGDNQAVANAGGTATYHTLVNITNTPNVPLVMVRPDPEVFTLVEGFAHSNNLYTGFYVAVQGWGSDGNATIDWRLYEAIKTSGYASHGIRLRNSAGEVFYDSSYKPFKVRQVISDIQVPDIGPPQLWEDFYMDINHPTIVNPFYILIPHGLWRGCHGGLSPSYAYAHTWFKTGLKKLSSTSVRVGWFCYGYGVGPGGAGSQGYNPKHTLLICEE